MIVEYLTGLPVAIRVDADGALTVGIDLSEADDHEEMTDEALAHVRKALARLRHTIVITV
jgi:hypothetical protein